MAVDRGGLDYTIRVRNEFSAELRQFRAELATARRSFNSFKRDVRGLQTDARGVDAALRRIATSTRQLDSANRAASASSRRRISSLQQELVALRSNNAALGQTIAARQRSVISLQQQNAALRSQVSILRRTATAQRRLASSSSTVASNLGRANTAATRGQAAFGGLLLTFRRLAATLIFFEAARFALDGIRAIISGTIEFSAALESATLGAASLFTAVGRVEDAAGVALQGVEALNAAQRVSEEQLRKLRVEGLRTAATFDQLAETFQVAVAPGLQAGLTVDQIRQFTVQISQAASALGLEQRQLAEEIRSILTATQRPGQTRIADALGLSRQDVRQAREAGRLFQLLQERFIAFSVAGSRALNTFNARLSNAVDALLLLSSTGAEGFFTTIKDLLLDVTEAAVTINEETRELAVNDELVRLFETVFDALARSVDQARQLASELDLGDLQNIAEGIAATIDVLSALFLGAFQGAIEGASDLLDIFRTVGRVAQAITGSALISQESLTRTREVVASFVRLFVVFRGLGIASSIIAAGFGSVAALLAVIGVALSSAVSDAEKLAEQVVGIENASFEGLFEGLSVEIGTALQNALVRVRLFLNESRILFLNNFTQLGAVLAQALVGPIAGALQRLRPLLEAAVTVTGNQELTRLLVGLDGLIAASQQRLSLEQAVTAETQSQIRAAREAADAEILQNNQRLELFREMRRNFEEAGGQGFQLLPEIVQEPINSLGQRVTAAIDQIKRKFEELGLTIPSETEKALDSIAELAEETGRVVARAADRSYQSLTQRFFARIRQELANYQRAGGAFDTFFNFLLDTTNRVADLISDLIVDAFDPNSTQTAKERIINFLRELAREAIRILIRIALAAAAAKIFGEGTGAGGDGDGAALQIGGDINIGGFQQGGKIKGFAQGGGVSPALAASGIPRPRGIDPRDTVPLWAQPDEWVIRKASTRKYGDQVMSAINEGLLDPFMLKALAAGSPRASRRRSRAGRMGFQTGGEVPAAVGVGSAAPIDSPQVVGAVVVADDSSLERLLNGGRNAMLQWFSDNRNAVNSVLT